MIKIFNGDILDAKEDIIGHQVNCLGVMGAGLAKQIKKKYPKCYEEYRDYVKLVKNNKQLLLGEVCYYRGSDKIIANLFGQLDIGTHKSQTNYDALLECFNHLHEAVTDKGSEFYEKTIALPYMIGCGLAGGNWSVVEEMIEEVFHNYDVVLYKLK